MSKLLILITASIAGVPYMRLPGRSRILLPLSEDGIYRRKFTGANMNLCYGLAWRWPQ